MQGEITKETIDRVKVIEKKHKEEEKHYELMFIQHLDGNNRR